MPTPIAHGGLSRRSFVFGGIGTLLLPLAANAAIDHAAPGVRLLSPISHAGQHFAVRLENDGRPHLATLPVRGHGLELDPRKPLEALIIARRPGTVAIKVNMDSGQVLKQWEAGEDRHFFGHGCYSPDGRAIFVTENDIETGKGLVTVRDADDFRVLAEYPTHGIGPHELLLLPDGVTLAIANGGIQTHPETGRVKLNRGRIDSSLVYLDSRDGKLLGHYPVASTQHSLRHLAIASNGRLAAALQFEGDRKLPGSRLMAFHHGEPALQFAEAPQAAWDRMQHYAASVAYDPTSDCFALTCPRGNTLACWTALGRYAGHIDLPKVSGVAFAGERGFASNELGAVYRIDLRRLTADLYTKLDGMQWDNHLYVAES